MADPPRSVRASLEASTTTWGLTQIVTSIVIAFAATSRAAHHTLSAVAVVGLVVVWTGAIATLSWLRGLYEGANEVLTGKVAFHPDPLPGPTWSHDNAAVAAERRYTATDGFAPGPMWRASLLAAVLAVAWAGAGAGLVAAVLNGRQAGFLVVAAAVAGLSGTASAVVDVVARRHGMAAARHLDAQPVALRRRAWRQVALPLALIQTVTNGAGAWLLFHSYHRPAPGGLTSTGQALTSHVATADALVVILVIGAFVAPLAVAFGRVDAKLGRVNFDRVSTTAMLGPQYFVYVAALILGAAKLEQILLPHAPSLIGVGVARAALAGVTALLLTGFGYVRGAVNGRVEAWT